MQQELIHHLLLKKVDLAGLKSNVDKLDVDKLIHVPVNLSSTNDVVQKDVYNAKIKNLEDEIPGIYQLSY